MNHEELLATLRSTAMGISKLLGRDTEVVLHDLKKGQIVFIANGYITGREEGYKINQSVYNAVIDLADADGHLIGYGSSSAKGKNLRSSHFIYKDRSGKPDALICINQDISKLKDARELLDSMIQLSPLMQNDEPEMEDEFYIQKITKRVIVESIEHIKPNTVDTKEGKMEVLRQLEMRGIFTVKDAVPSVCKLLSISQATLYNYLREIRSEENEQQSRLQL